MGATYSSHADRCLKRSSTLRNHTRYEPRFRTLLAEEEADIGLSLDRRLCVHALLAELPGKVEQPPDTPSLLKP